MSDHRHVTYNRAERVIKKRAPVSVSSIVRKKVSWKNVRRSLFLAKSQSPENMRKLCLSTKFPLHEVRWNYGILGSVRKGRQQSCFFVNFIKCSGRLLYRETVTSNFWLASAKIYLIKVCSRNTRKRCRVRSKLVIKTSERRLEWGIPVLLNKLLK